MDGFNKLRKIEIKTEKVAIVWLGTQDVSNIVGVFVDRAEAFKLCSELLREGKNAHVTETALSTPSILNASRQVWVVGNSAGQFAAFCTAETAHERAQSIAGGPVRVFVADAIEKAMDPADLEKMQHAAFKVALSQPKKTGSLVICQEPIKCTPQRREAQQYKSRPARL